MFVFSNILRELRLEKGINQSVMAEVLGVSMQSYSAYENGREPNYDLLIKIASYFEVTTDYLLGVSNYKNEEEQRIDLESKTERAVDKHTLEIYRLISDCYLNFEVIYYEKYRYHEQSDEKVFPKMNHIIHRQITGIIENYSALGEALMGSVITSSTDYIFDFLLNTKGDNVSAEVFAEIIKLNK